MQDKELIDFCHEIAKANTYIEFSNDVYKEITIEQAKFLADTFKHNKMMRLPLREIKFFEWLKLNDPPVWHDLWDNENEEPYYVSFSFLPLLIDRTQGFPICDLLENDNYFFVPTHLISQDSELFIESVKKRYIEKESITTAQLLALEISLNPIDIWHFAFKHKINLDEAKHAVEELVEDQIIVHLTETAHLAGFIDFI